MLDTCDALGINRLNVGVEYAVKVCMYTFEGPDTHPANASYMTYCSMQV